MISFLGKCSSPKPVPRIASFSEDGLFDKSVTENVYRKEEVAPMTYSHSVCGITINFPYKEPYQAQRAIMANALAAFSKHQNALLESPTGTGKSLALLASALAYQSHIAESLSPEVPPIRIWYTSRTHTQLRQLVSELKRLPYTPRMTILASRRHFCLYEKVNHAPNIESQCRAERANCPYVATPSEIPDQFSAGKWDVQELTEYCRTQVQCPFFIARESDSLSVQLHH
jgi:Rad3-related DNA helicase